jgi:RNA recognition motif-containing protein
MNIYAGNLSPETTEDDLRQTFGAFGEVASVKILKDRATGKSNGFGFVGMAACDEGQTAISELNGKQLKGYAIKVEEGKKKISHRSDQDGQNSYGGHHGDRDGRGRRRLTLCAGVSGLF